MSWVGVAIGGMKVMGQIQQGQAAKSTANAQAQSLDYQAQQEQQASLDQAAIIRRAGRYTEASATAAYAGAGVKVGEGSAADVSAQIQTDSEHDAFTTILNGTKRSNALRATGTMSRTQGDLAASQANMAAMGTALSSGYSGMQGSGWRTAGPGFSGTQAPAPVSTATVKWNG
jgi:hypothetical protein